MTNSRIGIIDYEPPYAAYFERFNKAWLEAYYTVEPIDRYVLENPEEAIIRPGGRILFAEYEGKIIGTVALKPVSPGVYELTKMAVDEAARGLGAGKRLCEAAIQEAKRLHAHKLILYSQTRLVTAIAIYRRMGFTEIPLEPGAYQRADIQMELPLKDSLSPQEVSSLIESYGQAYYKIRECLDTIPRAIWDWQPPYRKWTIRQNIIHLTDSEVNSYIRCRRFIAEPGSKVLGYDQDKWAGLLFYNKQGTDDALELFRLLRKMSYDLVRQVPYETWESTVEHSENGKMKMWQWLRYYENHTHILQMKRVHHAWKKEHQPQNPGQ